MYLESFTLPDNDTDARLYNLDADPAETCSWWELPNVRIYAEFFEKNRQHF